MVRIQLIIERLLSYIGYVISFNWQVEVPQVRAALEKTLLWLVPLANNTIRYCTF